MWNLIKGSQDLKVWKPLLKRFLISIFLLTNISYITQIYKWKPYLQTLYTTIARWCSPSSGCFLFFLMFWIIPLSMDLMAFSLTQYFSRKVIMVVSYHSWLFSSHITYSVCLTSYFFCKRTIFIHAHHTLVWIWHIKLMLFF